MKKLSLLTCIGLLLVASAAMYAEEPKVNWDPAYSGNYTVGRGGNSIQYIIVHVVQGSYSGCISWFKNPSAKVSAHYVLSKGGAITQMVKDSDTGWHAGNWSYNQRSIGLEHEGYVTDNFSDTMYRSSAALVRSLCNKYGIPKDRNHIIGHVEVPGATHTDPGKNWNWGVFMSYVNGREPVAAPQLVKVEAPTLEEYKIKVCSTEYNVEKLQKSLSVRSGNLYRESVTIANLFESNFRLPMSNLEPYVACDACVQFPEVWSEESEITCDAEQTGDLDLIYLYDRHDCEVWMKTPASDWQKLGNLAAYAFKGYRLETK